MIGFLKTCGVCTSQISSLGKVSCTTASRPRFTVSTEGIAATQAPVARAPSHTAPDEACRGERANSVMHHDPAAIGRQLDEAVMDALTPLGPSGYD